MLRLDHTPSERESERETESVYCCRVNRRLQHNSRERACNMFALGNFGGSVPDGVSASPPLPLSPALSTSIAVLHLVWHWSLVKSCGATLRCHSMLSTRADGGRERQLRNRNSCQTCAPTTHGCCGRGWREDCCICPASSCLLVQETQ